MGRPKTGRTAQGIANLKLAKQNYRERNRELLRLKAKEYHARPEVRAEMAVKARARYKQDPRKAAAQLVLSRAIAKDEIRRLPCEICGNLNSEGHHEDYDCPLTVIWLCKPCHSRLHNQPHNPQPLFIL